MYDARAVANFLLQYADENKVPVTLISVLKMIYYAHGWYLSCFREPLVKQPFEAWKYGPVVRVVWESFKGSGKKPITTRAQRFDVVTNSYLKIDDPISDEDALFLRKVFEAYAHIDSFDLSSMTHIPGSPWDEVWNAPGAAINLGMKIPNDEIRKWFAGKRAPGSLH